MKGRHALSGVLLFAIVFVSFRVGQLSRESIDTVAVRTRRPPHQARLSPRSDESHVEPVHSDTPEAFNTPMPTTRTEPVSTRPGKRRVIASSAGSDSGESVHSQPLVSRIKRWTGKAAVQQHDVPIADSGKVPRRMWSTWKTKRLEGRASELHLNWLEHEPDLEHIIVSDEECADVAALYPGLKQHYDRLPISVMRADICRVLLVYFFGGYYRDLDVDFRLPLADWIIDSDGLTVGFEDLEHVCQWFFAARPGNMCLRHVIQHIANLVVNVTAIDFDKNIEAIIDTTGPGAWTDALQGCTWKPRFNRTEMQEIVVFHEYASAKWTGPEYRSWIEDRKDTAGWKVQWPRYDYKKHVMTPQDQHLLRQDPSIVPIRVSDVRSKSARMKQKMLHGPQLAFDGSLDTAFESSESDEEWFSFSFDDPVTIGTVFDARDVAENHLCGLRLHNRHREVAFHDHGKHATILELYDEHGSLIHAARKEARKAPYFDFLFAGVPTNVTRVVLWKRDMGVLTFSEIEFCFDPQCRTARPVHVHPALDDGKSLALLERLRVNRTCRQGRALTPGAGFQYTLCSALPSSCTGVALSLHRFTIDGPFADAMVSRNCTLQPVGDAGIRVDGPMRKGPAFQNIVRDGARLVMLPPPERLRKPFETTFCDGACLSAERFQQVTGFESGSPINVLYLDLSAAEWLQPLGESIVKVVCDLPVENLLVPLRLSKDVVSSATAIQLLDALLDSFELRAFHVDPGQGDFTDAEDVTYPHEIHLSLTHKRK